MKNRTIPPYLQPGDTIGITCPSGYLPAEKTIIAQKTLETWGFKVVTGNTVGNGHHYFSGTDEQRLADLQAMLDNKEIRAILMGRGGYGLSRIIDKIDFSNFLAHPKWICGFSDITLLHSHIQASFGMATLHSPMCGAFREDNITGPEIGSVLQALTGETIAYPLLPQEHNRPGSGSGTLVGGNLAILAHVSGSVSQMDTRGKLLFLEDVGEYLYGADRMLLNLKRAGMLRDLKGLVCGGFTEMKDTERPFGQDIYAIIKEAVQEYGYPVCFDFPAGHQEVNYALPLGLAYELQVSGQQVSLSRVPDPETIAKYRD